MVVVDGQLQGVYTERSKWAACSMEAMLEKAVVERSRGNVVSGASSRHTRYFT